MLGGELADLNKHLLIKRLLIKKAGGPNEPILLAIAYKCWNWCLRRTTRCTPYAPALPLIGLPHGDPMQIFTDTQMRQWEECEIKKVGDCYESGQLMPLESLMDTYDLPP